MVQPSAKFIFFDTVLRGESFRETFLHVGELRSLVSPNVRMMALTESISRSAREFSQRLLGMHSPKVFAISPSKANIKFHVCHGFESIEEAFTP